MTARCSPQLSTAGPISVLGGTLYYLNQVKVFDTALMSVPTSGVPDGGGTTLGPAMDAPIAVDSSGVYYSAPDTDGGVQIVRVGLDGGAPVVLAGGVGDARGITTDATYVYWADDVRRQILRAAK